MQKVNTVGIIGLGAFGVFLHGLLPESVKVLAYDTAKKDVPGVTFGSLEEVCATDIVVLCIPLNVYEQILPRISTHLKSDTLVVDICSVKTKPQALLHQHLPHHQNLLVTHPMFGPQSAPNGTSGHTLVVCEASGRRAEQVLDYCEKMLKLKLLEMSADEHDKEMSLVHALTFFVARGLGEMHPKTSCFAAPSYQLIQNLVAFDATHSDELFQTIQKGNPYAPKVRRELIKQLEAIDETLGSSL